MLLLQLMADKLSSFTAEELSQLIWAYAQFGHTPPAPLLSAVLAQAETAVATLQPDSLAMMLAALQSLGCQPSAGLLSAAADVAVANMATFGVPALVDLLQVNNSFYPHASVCLMCVISVANHSGYTCCYQII